MVIPLKQYKSQQWLQGGAISVTRSKITIIQSMFEGNSAKLDGVIFSELNSNVYSGFQDDRIDRASAIF